MKEETTPNIFPGQNWKVKEEKEEPTAEEIAQDFQSVSAKDIEADKVKTKLQSPGHTVEIDGQSPLSPTRKVALEDIRKYQEENKPAVVLAPKKEEKSEWQYTNSEGHGIRATVLDPIDDFNTKQKAEERVMKAAGLEEKNYKVDLRDNLTPEEREEINLHNKTAGGIKIDPQKMDKALEQKESAFQFKDVKPPKRKSTLQVDPKNLYSSKARWT